MTLSVGDILLGTYNWTNRIEKGMIVRHYRVTDVSDDDDNASLQGLVDAMKDLGETITNDIHANGTTFVSATLARIETNPTRIFSAFGIGIPVAGNFQGTGAQQAVVASLYPDAGSTPKQGRNFIPFLRGDYSESGQLETATVPDILAVIEPILLDDIPAAALAIMEPIIYSYSTQLAAKIKTLVLRPVLGTQRRRVDPHQNYTT